MKTKALLGVIVLVVMPVVIAYLFMQRDQPDTDNPAAGGNMEPLTARMDFELESMSADFAREVERTINEEVAAERDVHVAVHPREEALTIPDLIRTKVNLIPESVQQIRTIDIEGLDLQADGGLHVHNTREVGTIRVVKHESKGRINKRLRIRVE